MREEAAVVGYQMEAGSVAIQRFSTAQIHGPDDEEHHNRQHFNQRKPELHFGEPLHAYHVHGADNRQRPQRKHPLRHIAKRAPIVHVERHGGDVNNAGHRPVDEVHPACHVGGLFTEKLTGVGDEAAARRTV